MPPDYDVPCPTCQAPAHAPCRSLTSGRTTDTHAARISLQHHRQEQESTDE